MTPPPWAQLGTRRRLCGALSIAVAGAMTATACGTSSLPTATSPAIASPAGGSAASKAVTASVRVVPFRVAELSFVVAAPVKEVSVTEGDTVRAGQTLIVLDAPELAFAETAAQDALKSAQADEIIQSSGRRKWNGFKFVWLAGPPEQRQRAVARVVQAQAGLEAAQAELAQATLVAPFDGTVASIKVVPGELVQPGEIALVLGDLAHLQVETTDLSERLIAGVRLGQTARIRLKAFPNDLTARVSAIAPMAGQSADGDTIYKVTLALDAQPPGLMWGMTGDVQIDTQQ
jgi:multidrug efflux pump subunit AcrA (membrane-fusion protein)